MWENLTRAASELTVAEFSVSLFLFDFILLCMRLLLFCSFYFFAEIPNDRVCCTLMITFANAVDIAHFN
jgi:hypothetical protein